MIVPHLIILFQDSQTGRLLIIDNIIEKKKYCNYKNWFIIYY